jgi:hypothetical protein
MSQLLINKNTQRPSKMTVGILPLAGDPLGASFHEAAVRHRSTRTSSTNLLYLRDRHISPKLRRRVMEGLASEKDPSGAGQLRICHAVARPKCAMLQPMSTPKTVSIVRSRRCVYRKLKLGRSGDEVRLGWRVIRCFRFAEFGE